MSFDEVLADNLELGKKTTYDDFYNPNRLVPILREKKRLEIGIEPHVLPFYGKDLWSHFEVSWLNEKGKPIVAVAEIVFDASSPYLIESKSMKLYFNSLNNTRFSHQDQITELIKKDLEERAKQEVIVKLIPLHNLQDEIMYKSFEGRSIDHLDIECSVYTVDPNLLSTEEYIADETLFSDLLRSNCLVTGQPDWGSIQIAYRGKKINEENLLRYIISFRNHNEFGEHCVERIFMDLMRECKPHVLTVYGRYTRRGGIDINCYRSTEKVMSVSNRRLCRQ